MTSAVLMSSARAAGLALMLAAAPALTASAYAQTPAAQAPASTTPAHPLEFDIMGALVGPTSFGSRPITLATPNGSALHVAETTSSLTTGTGIEAHLGRTLSSTVSFEAIGSWTHRQYQTSVSGDIEQAPSVDATIGASRFVIEGAGVYTLHHTPSTAVFALGGLGWVREVASGNALAQNGALVDLGGGVKYWLGGAAAASRHTRYGVRAEAHVLVHRAGIALDDKSSRVAPAISAGFIIRF
jgi:hypothetical protein